MPILPPRNLPLSPEGGKERKDGALGASRKATGHPASRRDGASGSAPRSNPSTPVRSNAGTVDALSSPSVDRNGFSPSGLAGQLERQDETTFHRRLRTLLYDHRAARDTWDDLVSVDGAKSIAALSQLVAQLEESLLKKAGPEVGPAHAPLPKILAVSSAELEARHLDEIASAAQDIKTEQDALEAILARLVKPVVKMETLSEAANALLVDCTRARGDLFAFEQEAWTTWPFARFVDVICDLTSRYAVQTEHLTTLLTTLMTRGCVGRGEAERGDGDVEDTSKEGLDEENSEEEEDGDDEAVYIRQDRKARAFVRQRVLEEWQALPYLRHDRMGQDSEWFEDICEAEVGRWNE